MSKTKRKQNSGFFLYVPGKIEISLSEGAILTSFFPEAKEMTIKEIQKRVNYSYERVNTSLKELEKKKIIFSKTIGKTLTYTADYDHLCLRFAFNRYMTERIIKLSERHLLIYKSLKEISNETFGIVILFGSYSKGNETKNSDIDLMVISDSQKQAEESVNKIKSTRGFNITLAFVKKTEFSKIKKENSELWEDIKNYSIVFNSQDIYYYWMYQDG
jgi:predicted nucleotidyltransferase